MSAPVHVIVNPEAGGGAPRKLRSELERALAARSVRFTLEETARRGHAVELARDAAARGAERVVVVGGDGTIHEAANGLLQARADLDRPGPALGVIPAGTGNDFVKMIEGAEDRRRVYETIASGAVRRFDVGRVEWEHGSEFFINGMGLGIDVEVVRQIERLPHLPGVLGYLAGLLRAVVGYRAIPLRIDLDGETLERKLMIIAIGNGACLGGGFYLCPGAVPDDGRFDACMIDELGYLGIARTIPRVLRGRHAGLPAVTMRQASAIRIEARGDVPLLFHLDGELREPPTARWLRIELVRRALPVLVPAPREAL